MTDRQKFTMPASPETRPAHFQCGGYLHYYDDGHTQRCDCEDCVSAVPKCKRCAGAGWFPLNPPIDGAKRIMCPVCYGNGESQKSPSSECDVLNQELRENYGDAFQVEPDDDWQPAIMALVDGVRRSERFRSRGVLQELEAVRQALSDTTEELQELKLRLHMGSVKSVEGTTPHRFVRESHADGTTDSCYLCGSQCQHCADLQKEIAALSRTAPEAVPGPSCCPAQGPNGEWCGQCAWCRERVPQSHAEDFEDWASHIIAEARTKADSQVEWEIVEVLNKAYRLGSASGPSRAPDEVVEKLRRERNCANVESLVLSLYADLQIAERDE